MGLFSSITKPFKSVIKKVVPKVIAKPLTRVITAAEQVVAKPTSVIQLASKGPVLGPIDFLAGAVTPKLAPVVSFATSLASSVVPGGAALRTGINLGTSLLPTGGKSMALDVGGILKSVGSIFGGGKNPIFDTISGAANVATQFFPSPVSQIAAMPTAARVPAIVGPMTRAVPTIGRTFFNRFPNLATSMQLLRNQGRNIKRSQLWSLLKRFGPEVLVTGGILTAAAVSELMVAGPGHRRMNPGNVKALRRSMRRLESFHKLCVTADKLRRPRSRSTSRGRTGSQQFVRQG